jgi:hypothetical protein
MCWLVLCFALGAGVLASGRGSARFAQASEAESGARADGVAVLERKLDTRVAKFDTGGRTLLQCVVDLAFQYKLPGAIEYAGGGGATRKLELQFEDETVRSMLEKLVKQNAGYRVDFSGGIVDVFSPRARQDAENPFNEVIRDVSVRDVDTHQADADLLCALGRQRGGQVCTASIAKGQWPNVKITLHMQNAKVYEILNAIVAQNGEAIWAVTYWPEEYYKRNENFWYVYALEEAFRETVYEGLVAARR